MVSGPCSSVPVSGYDYCEKACVVCVLVFRPGSGIIGLQILFSGGISMPVEVNASGVCPYCNSKIVGENTEWVMSKKISISQNIV